MEHAIQRKLVSLCKKPLMTKDLVKKKNKFDFGVASYPVLTLICIIFCESKK